MTDPQGRALAQALRELVEHPVVTPGLAERVIDRHRRRRLVGIVAAATSLVLVVTGVSVGWVALRSTGTPTPSPAASPSAGDLYTGTALLLSVRGGPFTACAGAIAESLPSAGCGGVPVSGFHLTELPPGTWTRAANGTVQTLPLTLVGRWDGERLDLTRPPTLAASATSVEPPDCPAPGATGTAQADAVTRDLARLAEQHIRPFSWGPCGDSVYLTVPLADQATVAFLTDRYPGAVVRGWLQPYAPTSVAAGSPATGKCAPPIAVLQFAAAGHAGNEWVLPVGTGGVTVRFLVTQRPGTKVEPVWFEIAPANAPYPGSEVRRFPPIGPAWFPGRHDASITWDGRDDNGRPLARGRYHLFANADTTDTTHDPCHGGSASHEAYGLGYFEVRG
jgi:hypothetical protein